MFPPIQLTKDRNTAIHAFDSLRLRALGARIWAKLSRRKARLASFSERPRTSVNRKFVGVQEIPIDKIVGTLGRETDFDHKFRPLSNHLRERWVNALISLSTEKWSSILVHKIGEQYFVEDGHHRISVTRAVGMAYIQAEVWEYSPCTVVAKFSQPARCRSTGCLSEARPAGF
jgi:hypothetical protein